MALDDHLLGLAASESIGFAARLYSWMPACVSFGKLQIPSREADLDAIVAAGVDIIRRPTGGRAVWHEHEITYSLVASGSHPLARGSISESLAMTGGALLRALAEAGVSADLIQAESAGLNNRIAGNPCFTSHGRYEITSGGRKLVGSAQARKGGAFLEHGSILMRNDQIRLLPFLRIQPENRKSIESTLIDGTCSLLDLAPGLDRLKLENALLGSFEELGGGSLAALSTAGFLDDGLAGSIASRKEEALGWLTKAR